MTMWIFKPYGTDGPLQLTHEAPTYREPQRVATYNVHGRRVGGQVAARLIVRNGRRPAVYFGFKHRRCDYVRHVKKPNDQFDVRAALQKVEAAEKALRKERQALQDVLLLAWPRALSGTVQQAKDATS